MNHTIPCIDLSKSRNSFIPCILRDSGSQNFSGGMKQHKSPMMNMEQAREIFDYYNSMGAKNPPKHYYEASKLLRGLGNSGDQNLPRSKSMSDMSDMTESECEKKYNKILKKVEKEMGHNGITNQYELQEYCDKNICNFTTVSGYDKMPKLKSGQSCIINLDDSKSPGTHWIACIRSSRDLVCYDSFARPSKGKNGILKKLKTNGLRVKDTDYDAEQDELETNCGMRCCAFLVFANKFGVENALKI